MSNPSSSEVANAIATCLRDPDGWRHQQGHSELLEESVRQIVFNRGALVPVGPLITASLVQVAAIHTAETSVAEVLQAWRGAVGDSCESYAREPEGWKQDEVREFEASVAASFGVDDEMVHELIRSFHGMREGSRLGALMMLEESPSFRWLSKEIDAFDREVELEAPPTALRRLLRLLYSAPEGDGAS
ncbi:hypothetical protein [Planctomycetes bacterium Poly30]